MTEKTLGNVLVTGGAGFIGSALSQQLASRAERWVAFDLMHPQVHRSAERPETLHPDAELVVGDVTEPQAWDALFGSLRPDLVIHLAAETGTAQSLHEASRHARVNVVGTTELLDGLGRAGIVPVGFLLASSRAVYGEGLWEHEDGTRFVPGQRSHAQLERGEWDFPGARPILSSIGSTPPTPTSVYGATKLAQENVLSAWVDAHDSALGILRLQNVYGPGQSLINSYTGIVSLFSQWAAEGRSIPVYEDGDITRDFVYIDDVASAFALLAERLPESGAVRFDVGSGVSTTIMQLAQAIAEYHEAPEPHVTGQYRDGDVRFASCDIAPTERGLDWRPEWGLVAGVSALQRWIATQPA
ncbi:NAD-dependent epimerase/dehydratase family protein [Agromyces archimandritae]|uniref:NAD(P)-dependent oxidoreductase n=1 Tax=Agromyces archimandritae TaxID=2781962 RepID=A0A975FMN0_9MICO|nr:NAD(P)-dependent oxidoreductase [Agromyces archimandritae]QTX05268.1 NAD(P)-dependent oxidoreductase [Agromyces archimandritae]